MASLRLPDYCRENVRLYLGENADVIDALATASAEARAGRLVFDSPVDHVVTDPPYGIDFQSAWRTNKEMWKPKISNDKKPFVAWIKESFRVLKDGGCLISFYRWDVQEEFKKEFFLLYSFRERF